MIKVNLTQAQLLSLGGAAIYAACNLSDPDEMPPDDQAVMLKLNAYASQLVKAGSIEPTELKDLGLALIKQAMGK